MEEPSPIDGGGAGQNLAIISKSMRVSQAGHASVRLKAEFWSCLAELAAERRVPLAALVREVAAAKPQGSSLASVLRVFARREARRRGGGT